jgi:hypothetical protein
MDITQARQLVSFLTQDEQAGLAAAHERYMYFTGVYTDQPKADRTVEDREAFPHLLVFTEDGRPSLSDERCSKFMAAVTGLPLEWCSAWDEIEFVSMHGERFVEKQLRIRESTRLAQAIEGGEVTEDGHAADVD